MNYALLPLIAIHRASIAAARVSRLFGCHTKFLSRTYDAVLSLPKRPLVYTFSPQFWAFSKQKLTLAFDRPRHFEKPETYLWEKIHLIDHPAMFAKQVGLRRRRWFQMYKVDQHGR